MAVDQNTYSYDPSQVVLIIGTHIVSGFAAGSFITCERNTDRFTRSAGAAGEQTRTKNLDSSGMLTLSLTQGSQTNNILAGFTALQDASAGNQDLFPFILRDLNGSSLASSEISWVLKPTSLIYADTPQNREWKIEASNLQITPNGLTPIAAP